MLPDLSALPLWATSGVFLAAATVVWISGFRLARYANSIADRTGIGKAFAGIVLLGGVTSLPEAAVSITAAVSGNALLAVNNLLGGVTMQVAILAAGDLLVLRALTAVVVQPAVILQGAFGVLMLMLVTAAIAIGDVAVFGVSIASVTLVVLCGVGVWMARADENLPGWTAVARDAGGESHQRSERRDPLQQVAVPGLLTRAGFTAFAILVGGVLLANAGDAIAEQTALGSSFVGAVLVATSTSLPEVSTVIAAIRLGQYGMAFSDIFGTNLFDLALIFVVDLFYGGPPVLEAVGEFSMLAALLGATVTVVYMIGLIERRDGTLPRIGFDSLAVALLYVSGLVLMYQLR